MHSVYRRVQPGIGRTNAPATQTVMPQPWHNARACYDDHIVHARGGFRARATILRNWWIIACVSTTTLATAILNVCPDRATGRSQRKGRPILTRYFYSGTTRSARRQPKTTGPWSDSTAGGVNSSEVKALSSITFPFSRYALNRSANHTLGMRSWPFTIPLGQLHRRTGRTSTTSGPFFVFNTRSVDKTPEQIGRPWGRPIVTFYGCVSRFLQLPSVERDQRRIRLSDWERTDKFVPMVQRGRRRHRIHRVRPNPVSVLPPWRSSPSGSNRLWPSAATCG